VRHAAEIEYNKDYTFNVANSTLFNYQGLDRGHSKSNFLWTIDKNAFIFFPIEKTTKNIEMVVEAYPYLGKGKIEQQNVDVFVNNTKVATASYWIMAPYRAFIPAN